MNKNNGYPRAIATGETARTSGGGCGAKDTVYGVKDRPVGSVYAPVQNFDGLYDLGRALSRGTIFADLDLPLEAAGRGRGYNGGVRHG